MYKARVEAVDGIRVKAGGKWLNCIGNKPVKVGDTIWTDGRCVYGNFQEAQSPIVITSSQEAIPIIMDMSLYTYKNSLKDTKLNSNKRIYYFSNDKHGNLCFLTDKKILASNINNGVVYYLIEDGNYISIVKNGVVIKNIENPAKTEAPQKAKSHFQSPTTSEQMYLRRIKCNFKLQPIQETDENGNIIAELLDELWIYLRYTKYYEGYSTISDSISRTIKSFQNTSDQHYCEWAFIENEKNWAIITTNFSTVDGGYPIGTYDFLEINNVLLGEGFIGHYPNIYSYNGKFTYTYLITPNGYDLIFEASESNGYSEGFYCDTNSVGYVIADWIGIPYSNSIPPTDDKTPLQNNCNFIKQKIPIQDGFYYIINSAIPNESSNYLPVYLNITIYTKNAKEIFTGTFVAIPYISICRIKGDKFLMAVIQRQGSPKNYLTEETEEIYAYDNICHQGLYEIKGGIATKIKYSNLSFANQCLRPMKNYKNWWNKIQDLT